VSWSSIEPNIVLYDFRLALIMQNEEFLRELKRNDDFMRTLEFERDMLANRLLHEQAKNRRLRVGEPPNSDGAPPNWMAGRASEWGDSLPRSLSPSSDTPGKISFSAQLPSSSTLRLVSALVWKS